MKCLIKYFKRQKLLKKYKQTEEKQLSQIRLHRLFSDDPEAQSFFRHHMMCEIRCYQRLKRL